MKTWPLFVIALVMSSCLGNLKETIDKASKTQSLNWNPNIAVPLVYSSLNMQDIVEVTDKYAQHRVEDDKSITLIYQGQLFSLRAEDAFQLPNQSYSDFNTLTPAQAAVLDATGNLSFQVTKDFDFALGSNELDSIILKGGTWDLSLNTNLQHNVDVTVTVIGSDLNGNELTSQIQASYGGNTPTSANESQILNRVILDLTLGNQGHSQLSLLFDVNIQKINGNPVAPGEYVNFGMGMQNLAFRYLKGYLPNANLSNGNDSMFIDVFKHNESGSFTLVDPKISLHFKNSFGTPLRASLLQFAGIHQNGNQINLNGYPAQFDFLAASSTGGIYIDSLSLDKSNSNLDDYINNKPYSNIYEYGIFTNPLNQNDRVWMLDTSVLQCDVELDFPLYGTAQNYSLESSAAFEIDSEIDEYVEEVLMRLHTENAFPVDLNLQVYLEDSVSGLILDSLFHDDLLVLASSSVDQNGKTEQVYPKTMDIPFDRDRLDVLKNANKISYVARFNTLEENGSQSDVKFFEEYELLIQFGIQAKFNINEPL
ncbi:MAG: hypothetical protein JXR19_00460 [Bacteroidia bacterium]